MLLCLISILSALLPISSVGQTSSGIPFTPAGIRSMNGKNICDFQGKFLYASDVYLDRARSYSVDYRERDGVFAVFLLSKPTGHCGIVDAALDLTHLIRKGEGIEFKCYTRQEGGTTWGKWGHVVGLADNHNGQERFAHARLAWRVDIKEKRFEGLEGQPVTCDTSGYEDFTMPFDELPVAFLPQKTFSTRETVSVLSHEIAH